MLIGEVSQRSGVPAKTLRYYEEVGLLRPPLRSASGYRHYEPEVFDRLAFIRSSRALWFSLGEIRGIIAVRDDGDAPCSHVLDLLVHRSAEIDRTIRDLHAVRSELRHLVAQAQQLDPADCVPRRVCHLIGPT